MQLSKVLVVDCDLAARDALVTCLKFVGIDAHGADNAFAARRWLSHDDADVMVVAHEVAEGVPTDSGASIIVLARDRAGVDAPSHFHIDETLRRPIAVSRVVERVESLIEDRAIRANGVLNFAALSLDVASGFASSAKTRVALHHVEARLLAFFIGFPDRVFSRAQLLQRLWPANVRVAERTVDVHIGRLRRSLANLDCANYLQTVRCVGYRFSAF